MEVKINREIRDYQENIFFGLNLRQLIFSVLAIAVAVGIYFGLWDLLSSETVSWLCIVGAFPFGAMGFIKYNGMTAEQFIVAFVKSELFLPRELCFQGENLYYAILEPVIENKTATTSQPKNKRRKKCD